MYAVYSVVIADQEGEEWTFVGSGEVITAKNMMIHDDDFVDYGDEELAAMDEGIYNILLVGPSSSVTRNCLHRFIILCCWRSYIGH